MWSEDSVPRAAQESSTSASQLSFSLGPRQHGGAAQPQKQRRSKPAQFLQDADSEWAAEEQLMQERVDGLLQEGRRAGIAGETKVALRAFDRLLFCQPNHAEALEMRAQILNEEGSAWAAVQSAARATILRPKWGDAWLTLSRCQANFGEVAMALESVEVARTCGTDLRTAEADIAEWERLSKASGDGDDLRRVVVRDGPAG